MAYTTTFRGTSSNTNRYNRDRYTTSEATNVDQKNTTQYWQAQGKQATTRAWTVGAEPTTP